MSVAVDRREPTDTRSSDGSTWHARLVEHRPFLIALGAGVLVRIVVTIAFTPALLQSDGPAYLARVHDLLPDPNRPVGYVIGLLKPLSWIADNVALYVAVQHVLGLLTAVLVYDLVRRWGAGRWWATIAALPVLFDSMQLMLEHAVLSDVFFCFLLVSAFWVLARRRVLRPGHAVIGGLLLGAAVTVRLVGEPLVLTGIGFALLLGGTWRNRTAAGLAVAVGFLAPVAAYAGWYHHETGRYALADATARSLYMRTTTFVDCSRLHLNRQERGLCPTEPLGHRLDPTQYAWHDLTKVPRLYLEVGATPNQTMRSFALAAIRAQPWDYARVVARDFLLNFDIARIDRFEYDTAYKWRFAHYIGLEPTTWTGPAFAAHGGSQLHSRQPWADIMAGYGWTIYLPGPVLLLGLVGGIAAALGVGRSRGSGVRSLTFLLTATAAGLMLVPAATAEVVWRYQLPALSLVPAAAALGWSALLGHRAPSWSGDAGLRNSRSKSTNRTTKTTR